MADNKKGKSKGILGKILREIKPLPGRTLTGKRKTPKDPTRTVKAEKVPTVQPTKNVNTVKEGQVRTAKINPPKEGETLVGTVQGSVIPGKGRKYPGRGRIRKTAKPGIVSAIEKKVKKRNIRRGVTKAGVAGLVGATIAIPLLDGKSSKYTIKEGDTLSEIAKRKGTTLGSLIKANPKLKNPNKIYTGKKVKLSKPVKNRKSVYQDVSKKEMEKMSVKKKHGGRINYRMTGGQVVDAGYD
jgi:LysM repeat protein|tara:strand:- start:1897 stop:2619 length:723 start_codon:yes stop_codon:yes gene_type:complete